MATEEHKQLSSFIKNVHENLRRNSRLLGAKEAWEIHCRDQEKLKDYAIAMQTLATTFWQQNSSDNTKDAQSRIEWIVQQCEDYFFKGDITRQRCKEQKILQLILEEEIVINERIATESKLRLLDVGSCYNPFQIYDYFDVIAIDIAPANDQVLKCDFLNVEVVQNKQANSCLEPPVTKLTECSFDVIVFSLLLEYLPSSEQRMKCCQNAYNLLKEEGVLIIITPDSKHVGANAKIMKCWRYALAQIGFSRIKYEKLSHIHCMVYRKAINKLVTERWATLHKEDGMKFEINIPQDIKKFKELDDVKFVQSLENDAETTVEYFCELPELYSS